MPNDQRERLRRRLLPTSGTARPEPASRIVFGIFGFVFFGIGVSVIVFLWSQPFGEFGSPPLIFRVFGSFIALAFVAMGGGTAYAAIIGGIKILDVDSADVDSPDDTANLRYQCDRCGAPLDADAEVAPHGDVKCRHCDCWFNIHGRG